MANNSVVDLSGLAKPADTLIKKVSAAVGGLFEPLQIERIAKAKAKAAAIEASASIEVTDLHRRAMVRWVNEEAQHQSNMEAITKLALPHLSEGAKPELLSDDWISNFFEKSRIVSDIDMQSLWAHLLAAEANDPGSFSRQTVNLVGDMGRADAELFEQLMRFAVDFSDGKTNTVIFDALYDGHGPLTFEDLITLESLGLTVHQPNGYSVQIVGEESAVYCGTHLTFEFGSDAERTLHGGQVLLTRPGEQLARLCKRKSFEGFLSTLKMRWPSLRIA